MSSLSPPLTTPCRPVPKRLLSLQDLADVPRPRPAPRSDVVTMDKPSRPVLRPSLPASPPTTFSASSPSSPVLSPTVSRPGAPKRSHSFCGDSTSTYALASAHAGTHLSADKKSLVAPPLERTLSSMGHAANTSPPGLQMLQPEPRVGRKSFPPRDGRSLSSPSRDRPQVQLPKIMIHEASPTRPGPNSARHPPPSPSSPLSSRSRSLPTSPSPTRPPLLRQESSMSCISPASSFTLATPNSASVSFHFHGKSSEPTGKPVNLDDELNRMTLRQDEHDDMMEVDEMVERVEDLVV